MTATAWVTKEDIGWIETLPNSVIHAAQEKRQQASSPSQRQGQNPLFDFVPELAPRRKACQFITALRFVVHYGAKESQRQHRTVLKLVQSTAGGMILQPVA